MTVKKFTPGPWVAMPTKTMQTQGEVDTFGVGFIDETKSAYPFWLAKLHPLNDTELDREQVEANARLMASAPGMFWALEECLKVLTPHKDDDGPGTHAYYAAKVAIDKAKGEI